MDISIADIMRGFITAVNRFIDFAATAPEGAAGNVKRPFFDLGEVVKS